MSDDITVKIIKNDGTEVVLTEKQWKSEDNQYCDMESDADYMISEGISSLQFFKDDMPHGPYYGYFESEEESMENTYFYHYSEYKNGKLHGDYLRRDEDGYIEEKSKYKKGKLHGYRYTYWHGQTFDDEDVLSDLEETYKKGKLHSYDDKPAKIEYAFVRDYETEVAKEYWYKDGKLHRKNGPAVIYHYNPDEYSEDGRIIDADTLGEFYSEEYWVDGVQVESSPEDTSSFQVRINGKGRKISLDKFNEEKEKFIKKGLDKLEYYKDGKEHREDGPAEIWYDSNGNISSEYWYLNGEELSIEEFANHLGVDHFKWKNGEVYLKDKKLHREDGPAVIEYHDDGSVSYESCYLNGEHLSIEEFANHLGVDHYKSETEEVYLKDKKLHREDGPAVIKYHYDGSVREEAWYLNGEYHRKDGPAHTQYRDFADMKSGKHETWYLNGKKHREDGPAYVWHKINGSVREEAWYLNGKKHREDGPAIVVYKKDGSVKKEAWYLNGVELPTEVVLEKLDYYKSETQEVYLKDGKLHREDGPARIGYNDDGSVSYEDWYLNGEKLSELEFYNKIKTKSKPDKP